MGSRRRRRERRVPTTPLLLALAVLLTCVAVPYTTSGVISKDDVTIAWRIETVDDTNCTTPNGTAVAVAGDGTVHVSYQDDLADGLRCARRAPDGTWSSELVDPSGLGGSSGIGVTPDGAVHVAYADVAGKLRHASRLVDGGWDIEVVDDGLVGFPTLDVKGDDVHITYLDRGAPSIRMATMSGPGKWDKDTLVTGAHLYWGELDLAIGENGSMHLVYLAGSHHPQLLDGYHAHKWPGVDWQVEAAPFTGGYHLSVSINRDGIPYVAANGGNKLYHRSPSGHWSGGIDYFPDQRFQERGAIRYDSDGNLMVCGRTQHDDLRYFQFTSVGFFRTGVIDGREGSGANVSMAVGPMDFFHVAYYDGSTGRLMYASDSDRTSEPLDPRATGGERAILLEWEMPSHLGDAGPVTFNIYRDRVEGSRYYYGLLATGVEGTSYRDTEVENRFYHHYYVVGVNTAGEGHFSYMRYARALLHPTMPLNVTATMDGDSVLLEWEPPEDPGEYTVTGYRIHWRTGSSSSFGPEWQYPRTEWNDLTVDGATLSYNHTGLDLAYTYRYQVAAVHASGEGERSDEVLAIPMVPPDEPTALAAERRDGRVLLNWTRPLDDGGCRLTAYRVYRGTPGSDLELLTEIKGLPGDFNLWQEPSEQLVDDGTVPDVVEWINEDGFYYTRPRESYEAPGELEGGETYYYQVSAVQLAGEGPRSAVLEVPPPGLSGRPRELEAEFVGEGVRLSWLPPMGGERPEGYAVYRVDRDGETVRVGSTRGDVLFYLDRGVESHEAYSYYVRVVGDAGEGPGSVVADVAVGEVVGGAGGGGPVIVYALAVALAVVGLVIVYVLRTRRKGA